MIATLKCDLSMSATHASGRNNSYAIIGTQLQSGYVDNNKVLKSNGSVLKQWEKTPTDMTDIILCQVWDPWRVGEGNVTILSRSYLFSVILSLFLVLSQEHMVTMMLLNHFLISYAQHLTCCILPYASHFIMPSPLTYHMFTFCIPCCYSMDIYYIN